jgi:hypothetical protein
VYATGPPLDCRVVRSLPVNAIGSAIALVYRFVSGLTLEKLKVMPGTLVFISDAGCAPAHQIHLYHYRSCLDFQVLGLVSSRPGSAMVYPTPSL